jgi:hypothetical protein
MVSAPGTLTARAATISDGFVTWVHVGETATSEFEDQLRRRSLKTNVTTRIPIADTYDSLAADGNTIYATIGLPRILTAQIPP